MFVVTCDNCESEIERGSGRPVGGSREAYCQKCAGIVSAAKKEARDWASREAERVYEQANERERDLIREWSGKKPTDSDTRVGVQSWPAIEQPS